VHCKHCLPTQNPKTDLFILQLSSALRSKCLEVTTTNAAGWAGQKHEAECNNGQETQYQRRQLDRLMNVGAPAISAMTNFGRSDGYSRAAIFHFGVVIGRLVKHDSLERLGRSPGKDYDYSHDKEGRQTGRSRK
jgi:hypothetical protein